MKHVEIDRNFLNKLYENKAMSNEKYDLGNGYYHLYVYVDIDSLENEDKKWGGYPRSSYYYPNGCIVYSENNRLYLVDHEKNIGHHTGNNPYQWATIDALYRNEIELLFQTGVAGSGKTYLALGYALDIIENSEYTNIVLSRPKQDLERSEGAVPGDDDDKIEPYMMPFYDNARSLGEIQKFKRLAKLCEDTNGIMFQPLEKIKGRSFEKSIVIVDEAEDCRYRELESLLTRLNGCKTIICGDIRQIDDRTFSKNNIPLVYAINKMKDENFIAHIENPITARKGKVTKFVINNFSYNEYKQTG